MNWMKLYGWMASIGSWFPNGMKSSAICPSTPDAEQDLYDAAIDAYLGDPDALEEDMADDPFEDDDPNDPEWKTRAEGVRSRRI